MGIHSEYTGLELHQPYQFIQETDPGAVGAGLFWLKVSTGSVGIRNTGNSAWLPVGGSATPITTKGDLYTYGTSPARLPVGSNGLVLIADSTQTLGIKWGSPSALPSWLSNSIDAPPSSPSANNDEFTSSATLPGGGSALWAWDNQQSATVSVSNDSLIFKSPQYMNLIHLIQTFTGVFDVYAKICSNFALANYNDTGLMVGDSSTGKRMCITVVSDTASTVSTSITVQKWTNNTSFSSQVFFGQFSYGQFVYLRIACDSTNLTFYYSANGFNWIQVFQEAKATFLTGGQNQVGYRLRPNANAAALSSDFFRRTV